MKIEVWCDNCNMSREWQGDEPSLTIFERIREHDADDDCGGTVSIRLMPKVKKKAKQYAMATYAHGMCYDCSESFPEGSSDSLVEDRVANHCIDTGHTATYTILHRPE